MSFLSRAWRSVIRVKSRTLLMCFLMLVISLLILMGFGTLYASRNTILIAKSKLSPVLIVKNTSNDDENYLEIRDTSQRLTEKINGMLRDQRVCTWNHLIVMNQKSIDFSSYTVMEGRPDDDSSSEMNVVLTGNDTSDMIEFHNGSWTLTEGRFYSLQELETKAYVCILEESLAQLNQLHVGETITTQTVVDQSRMEIMKPDDLFITWKVIGIYRNQLDDNPQFSEVRQVIADQELNENKILVPGTTLAQMAAAAANASEIVLSQREGTGSIEWLEEDQYNRGTVLMLNSPDDLETFVQEYNASANGLFNLESNNTKVENYGKPLRIIDFFAQIILAVVVINGILVIMISTAMMIRNRKSEIGIFISMGVRKSGIILQLLTELILEMGIAFFLAVFLAQLLIKPLGEYLLNLSVIQKETEFSEASENLSYLDTQQYFSEVTQEEVLSEFEVHLTVQVLLGCLICEFGILFISLLLSGVIVVRMNPRKILVSV